MISVICNELFAEVKKNKSSGLKQKNKPSILIRLFLKEEIIFKFTEEKKSPSLVS